LNLPPPGGFQQLSLLLFPFLKGEGVLFPSIGTVVFFCPRRMSLPSVSFFLPPGGDLVVLPFDMDPPLQESEFFLFPAPLCDELFFPFPPRADSVFSPRARRRFSSFWTQWCGFFPCFWARIFFFSLHPDKGPPRVPLLQPGRVDGVFFLFFSFTLGPVIFFSLPPTRRFFLGVFLNNRAFFFRPFFGG